MNPIAIYQSPSGVVEVRMDNDTVWLTQEQMTQLFGRERSVITKHIRNVFNEGELDEKSNVQNLYIPQSDKPVRFYNLDVIISVGCRIKSPQGVQFRQWATRLLREHLTLGYTVNRQRFEDNAAELEAALTLIRKAAQTPKRPNSAPTQAGGWWTSSPLHALRLAEWAPEQKDVLIRLIVNMLAQGGAA